MCYLCGSRMKGGSAVHGSTLRHRRELARRERVTGNRLDQGRPAWTISLSRWDDQYDM